MKDNAQGESVEVRFFVRKKRKEKKNELHQRGHDLLGAYGDHFDLLIFFFPFPYLSYSSL